MSEPFIGEIRMVGFNYAPRNWAFCDGQILDIIQNQALFSILGITYGGDGRVTFALPDLRGRVPIHFNNATYRIGQMGGESQLTLSVAEMPRHSHEVACSTNPAETQEPVGESVTLGVLEDEEAKPYTSHAEESELADMRENLLENTGGAHPHPNLQPYTVINFIIALEGLYPPRS